MEKSKVVNMILKLFVFASFLYTSAIMLKLRNINTAILLIFTVALWLILNKIDSLDKRIKLLEVE